MSKVSTRGNPDGNKRDMKAIQRCWKCIKLQTKNFDEGKARRQVVVNIGVRGGGGGGGAVAPPVAKIFGQNAWDSGKSARDKTYIDSNNIIYFHIESGFYNTTKRSMFQTFKWLCC